MRRMGTGNASLNDTAASQSTANSALGVNGGGPSPAVGLNSYFGPWTQQVDLRLARRFALSERHAITLDVQALSLLNHADYYVQNGNGVLPSSSSPWVPHVAMGPARTKHAIWCLTPVPGASGRSKLSAR